MWKKILTFVSVHVYCLECQPGPLGMEDGTIGNSQISSSSNYQDFYAWKGRLNGDSCWSSTKKDNNEWLQVEFLSVVTITAIQIQGFRQSEEDEYVEDLQVETGVLENSLNFIRNNYGSKIVSVKHNIELLFEKWMYDEKNCLYVCLLVCLFCFVLFCFVLFCFVCLFLWVFYSFIVILKINGRGVAKK